MKVKEYTLVENVEPKSFSEVLNGVIKKRKKGFETKFTVEGYFKAQKLKEGGKNG